MRMQPTRTTASSPGRRRRMRSVLVTLVAGAILGTGAIAASPPAPAAAADPVPSGKSALTNALSNKCVDTLDGGRGNGTALQQWTCYNGSANQTWDVVPTSGGYVKLALSAQPARVVDIEHAVANEGSITHLWDWYGGNSQQWRPAKTSEGVYELRSRLNDNMCLTIKDSSRADGGRFVTSACKGNTNAQRFKIAAGTTTPPTNPGGQVSNPFGSNVTVIDSTWSQSAIQSKVDEIARVQADKPAQFGTRRDAVIFAPGTYSADITVGFNTQILGAGKLPGDVKINGHTKAVAFQEESNVTQNFWRGVENLTVNPTGGKEQWAVSQAAPLRRVQINGDLILAQEGGNPVDRCGWASGGFMSDSRVTGKVDSCTQQQWYTRDSHLGAFEGERWNLMFQGVKADKAINAGGFAQTKRTVLDSTPVVREKPFVYLEGSEWRVFVPALKKNSSGTSWEGGNPAGESKPLSDFYIAKTSDSAAQLNSQAAAGKHLLFPPGIYRVNEPLRINNPNTIVLGIGMATLESSNSNTALEVGDVDGVKLAGLLIDAPGNTDTLVRIGGSQKSGVSHAANPTSMHDVFLRIGGRYGAKLNKAMVVNSNDVIGDHLWIWVADHADAYQVDWYNTSGTNGLVVNGDRVTMLGLFVEHFNQYQTLWNGQGGRTYFYQNETPYFPPNQEVWKNGSKNGWAAYKVADHVTDHQATGLGSYGVYFRPGFQPIEWDVHQWSSFEVPRNAGVQMRNMITLPITRGYVENVINGTGGSSPNVGAPAIVEWYAG